MSLILVALVLYDLCVMADTGLPAEYYAVLGLKFELFII